LGLRKYFSFFFSQNSSKTDQKRKEAYYDIMKTKKNIY